ncbi:LysR family transcriptional regulator [Sulfitobacter sp.]|uniref:LysR family transcriptional regulator n=1 Tax=Sulfitobacter sp. TaxID=1903071 RepID=UPI003001FF5D
MIEKISDLKLFKRIVEMGTLSAAAGEIGLSPGSASLRLSGMERVLGVQLFRRTTRQMHLTQAGAEFLETAEAVLAELSNLEENLSDKNQNLSGSLQITAPVDLGRNYIAPSIDKFINANPNVSINLVCTDRITDLTERGIDIAIRYGALRDSSLRLRRVSSNRRIPVASPAYIQEHGKPMHPQDLKTHNCMLLSSQGKKNSNWTFFENDNAITVRVSGDRSTNDGEVARHWAKQGFGIALKSAWDVAEDINYGRLVPLLTSYCPPNVDLQLVFPPLARQPQRVRRLADHLVGDLKKLDTCLTNVELTPFYRNQDA